MFFNILGIIVSLVATIIAIVFVAAINAVSSYDSCYPIEDVCYCFKSDGSGVKCKSLPLMFYKVKFLASFLEYAPKFASIIVRKLDLRKVGAGGGRGKLCFLIYFDLN